MKVMSRISLALLGAMIVSSIGYGLVTLIIVSGNWGFTAESIQMIGTSLSGVGYLILFWLFTKEMKKVPLEKVNEQKKFTVYEAMKHYLVLLGGTTICSFFGDSLTRGLFILAGNKNSSIGIVESTLEGTNLALVIICVVIIAPITEELLFRKVLLERLLPYGKIVAIWAGSLLFGLYHFNTEQLFYTIFLGVICANVVIKTGKVRNAVFIHMAFNLFGGVISDYIPGARGFTILLKLVFVVSAVVIILIWGRDMFVFREDKRADLLEFKCKEEMRSSGFILYIVLFIINVIGMITD